MKKRINFCLVVLILVMFISANAFAGFSLSGKKKKGGETASTEDVSSQQSALIKKYQEYSSKITKAQILMAQAFGFKELKEKLDVQSKNLESGNVMTKDDMEKQRKLTESAQNKIDNQMAEGEELSEEGKKYYQKSLTPYFGSVLIYGRDVIPGAKTCLEGAKNVISNASMTEKLKVKKTFKVILYLGPKVGPDFKNLTSFGKNLLTYGKKNKIPTPKDAKESSKALGDL
ncbi:MAG: hypothetical protein K8R67_16745 [Desulfobacteraceae bacterium]|nr:hypothetical protein [Desulfobacteraceae bacterium]